MSLRQLHDLTQAVSQAHTVQSFCWAVPYVDDVARPTDTQLARLAPPRRHQLSVFRWYAERGVARIEGEKRRDGLHVGRVVGYGGQDVYIAVVCDQLCSPDLRGVRHTDLGKNDDALKQLIHEPSTGDDAAGFELELDSSRLARRAPVPHPANQPGYIFPATHAMPA